MKTSIFQLALAGVLPLAAATTFQELKDDSPCVLTERAALDFVGL